MSDQPGPEWIEEFMGVHGQPPCPHCGAAMNRHQAISPGHCGKPTCQAVSLTKASNDRTAQRASDHEDQRQAARQLARPELARAALALGANPEDMLVAVVPFQSSNITPLPPERREAFEAHLDRILAEAFATGDDVELTQRASKSTAEPAIVTAACTACQGLCCQRGAAKHAFLSAQLLVHHIRADPTASADSLRQIYLDALPEVSSEGSCVYHSAKGCSLPRDRRASICNRFYCHEIVALHDQTGGQGGLPIALVGLENHIPRKMISFDARLGGMVLSETVDDQSDVP